MAGWVGAEAMLVCLWCCRLFREQQQKKKEVKKKVAAGPGARPPRNLGVS